MHLWLLIRHTEQENSIPNSVREGLISTDASYKFLSFSPALSNYQGILKHNKNVQVTYSCLFLSFEKTVLISTGDQWYKLKYFLP